MRHQLSYAFLLMLALVSFAPGREVVIGQRTLKVADGFDVELVAGPPLVERPITISSDEQGQLYVTDSGGLSEHADKQILAKPHRVRRLQDIDGDGRFDKSTLIADHMMFPEGCLWYGGSVYVAAPPQIWKLTNAGPGDRLFSKEVWFDGKTLTGCGNDLHGPYLGRDGWFYWCKGFFAEQHHTLGNGKSFTTRAAHIFRSRPDGSKLEPVFTGGMDNPVCIAFLSSGERIIGATIFITPVNGKRDGLIHAIYGGVYGKKNVVLDGHPQTGDLMPLLSHQGVAAPAGIIAASDSLFGGGYADRVLCAYFNLHKVAIHELVPDGATFHTRDTDLFSCDHPDFHPTDVFEDADGSLLVVDTGGWYKMCCSMLLSKPDVMGAIYRIRKQGVTPLQDPYGLKLAWGAMKAQDLAGLLSDHRLFVRRRAVAQLRQQGDDAASALRQVIAASPDANARREAVWALASIDGIAARQAVRLALADADRTVVPAAINVAGLWRDREALEPLMRFVVGDDAALAREAAEAIGRSGDRRGVPALLHGVEKIGVSTPDSTGAPAEAPQRILEHSLIYAMIEIADAPSIATGLTSANPNVQRAALVAFDQMDHSALRPEQVSPLLDSGNPMLKLTAAWIIGHRPQWGAALADQFRNRLAHPPTDAAAQAGLVAQLAKLSKSPAIVDLLAATLRTSDDPTTRQIAIDAMAGAELSEAPTSWLDELARLLPTAQGPLLARAVSVAGALPQSGAGHAALKAALTDVGRQRQHPDALRIEALQAAGRLHQVDAELLKDLLNMARPGEPLGVRSGAAAVLATANLTPDQYLLIADSIRDIGPLELPKLLPAFDRATPTDALGTALVASLKVTKGQRGLRPEALKPLFDRFSPAVQQSGQSLLSQLNPSAAEQTAHLDNLAQELPKGDFQRGQGLFFNERVGCFNCHLIGIQGGKLGPDLTNIAKIRTDKYLLEAIVYPSASFARGYEPIMVKRQDGDVLAGIIVSQSREDMLLRTGPREMKRVRMSDILDIRPGTVSLMPDGFEGILSKQDLADVMAFLRGR